MRKIRNLHRWLGLFLAPFLIVAGLTGAVTAVLAEADMPASGPLPPLQSIMDVMREQGPAGGRLVALGFSDRRESPLTLLFRLEGEGPRRFHRLLLDGEGRIHGQQRPEDMPALIRKFHSSLLLGDGGETIVGLTGVGMALLLLCGAALWWPSRNRGLVLRRDLGWPRFFADMHRIAGMIVGVVLLLSAVTGVAMAFPKVTQAILGLDGPLVPRSVASIGTGAEAKVDADQAVAIAQAVFPDARPSRLQLPDGPGGSYRVTLRQQGEVRSRGFTFVWVDPRGGHVLRVLDPNRFTLAQTVMMWLQPVHTGEVVGGVAGRALALILGFAIVVLVMSAILAWVWRRSRSRSRVNQFAKSTLQGRSS